MTHPDSERLASHLFALAGYLHHEMKKRMDSPLNPTQMKTLFLIRCQGNPLMREIAEYLSIRPPSATVLVEELRKLKFVKRVPDRTDKRAIRVSLTPQGQAFIQRRFHLFVERVDALIRSLPATERKQFIQTLEKILTLADQHPV